MVDPYVVVVQFSGVVIGLPPLQIAFNASQIYVKGLWDQGSFRATSDTGCVFCSCQTEMRFR